MHQLYRRGYRRPYTNFIENPCTNFIENPCTNFIENDIEDERMHAPTL